MTSSGQIRGAHEICGLDYINELFEAGEIKPVIDGPYKLSRTVEAIRHFGEGKHKGKVIIIMEDGL